MIPSLTRSSTVLVDTLTKRCLGLGLIVWPWRAGAPGDPMTPGSNAPWLASPLLTQWVQRAASAWSNEPDPRPVELFAGCWLIPIFQNGVMSRQPVILATVFTGASLTAPGFEDLCASVGLEVEEGRRSLSELVQRTPPDPNQLKTMIQWTCEDLSQTAKDSVALDEFSDKLIQSYEESSFLYRLARLLHSCSCPFESYETACLQIQQVMPFRWVAARFVANTVVRELSTQLIVAGDLSCSREMFNQSVSVLMNQFKSDDWTLLLRPDCNELAGLVGSEVLVEGIVHDGRVVGLLLAGNKQDKDPEISSNETQFFEATADFLSVFYENAARFQEQRTLLFGTLQARTASIDAKDRYTCGHSERVSLLGSQLALVMGLDEKQVEQVRIAGLVHDVGKIGVSESVLCKPGKLTPEEFEQMKQHPVIGYEILKDIPPLTDMLPGVLYHHERWDGRGYPQGLRGEQIPIYGRLLACADTFDAMSSTRSYRPALPRQKVLSEFESCAGTQFDPEFARRFVKLDFAQYDATVDRHRAAATTFAA